MKTIILFTASIIITASSVCCQVTVTGFEAPESVIRVGDKIFVSNIGGEKADPMALDSNGFISELSKDGKMLHRKFQKTLLNAPKGLALMKDIIYTADINRVVGFNIRTGEKVFEISIPAKMLNDLCKVDDKHLCVSETASGHVLLIDITDKSFRFLGTIESANGVTYDGKTGTLYAVGMGAHMSGGKMYMKRLTNTDTVFSELPNSPTGIFDGLELYDDTHLLASDWISFTSKTGRLVVYDLVNHTMKVYEVAAGPADISYDQSSQTIYIPQMMKNSLLFENIKMLNLQ